MQIAGTTALVTGANRGLGAALASELVERRAGRVLAGVRDPAAAVPDGCERLLLDVTDAEQVTAAAAAHGDVTLLINNAVRADAPSPAISAESMDVARAQMETNYFGPLAMCRAFAPVLAANGGGYVVNVASIVSFMNVPELASFCPTKAALWSLTNGIRIELAAQGTRVLGVHSGFIDTRNAIDTDLPKHDPAVVAGAILDAVAADAEELLVDDRTRRAKAAIPHDLERLYPELARQYAAR